jgi:diacylglycerol kinase (ATP)
VEPPSHSNPGAADLLLVNPVAGGGRAAASLPELKKFAIRRNWNIEFCVTESAVDLDAKARRAAEDGRKRIFVFGGDGTFQVLLNAVVNYPHIILGVIPAGGGNDLAAALGLPQNPIQAAALLLNGEVRCLDVIRVRTADGCERLYSGGGGVGLDAEAARYANSSYRNLRGRLRYLLAAIRALVGFHAINVHITTSPAQPEPLESVALLVGALNTPSYGAGLRLAPDAKTDDGMLDLVLLENLGVFEILALLPAFASRGELKTKRIRRFRLKCARIETDVPHWFHADGELLGMTAVEISVIPHAVQMLCPARKANPIGSR